MSILFSDAFIDKDEWYLCSKKFNCLLKLKSNLYQATPLVFFNQGDFLMPSLHGKIICHREKLYCFPLFNGIAATINIYDKCTRLTSYITFPNIDLQTRSKKFEYILDNNKVWIFPRDYKYPLLVFDLDSYNFIIHSNWEYYLKDVKLDKSAPLFSHIIKTDDSIWFALHNTMFFIEFNIYTNKVVKHTFPLGGKNFKFHTLQFDGESFWITLFDSPNLYSFHRKNKSVEKYTNNLFLNKKVFTPYNRIIIWKDNVLLLSSYPYLLFSVNKKEKKILPIHLDYKSIIHRLNHHTSISLYTNYILKNNTLYLLPSTEDMMLIINLSTFSVKGTYVTMGRYNKNLFNSIYVHFYSSLKNATILRDNCISNMTVPLFFQYVKDKSSEITKNDSEQASKIGSVIYNALKGSF